MNLIHVILDKSGSMSNAVQPTISGFNEFLANMKREVPDAQFGLTLFDTSYEERYVSAPISEVAELTFDTYRPDGNTVFSIPGNPPIATARDLRNGQLQTLGQGLEPVPVPALITFQYEAQVPASWQWQAGVQRALPWSTVRKRPWRSVEPTTTPLRSMRSRPTRWRSGRCARGARTFAATGWSSAPT